MRAIQITDLSGPDSALELVDVAEPEASHPMTPGEGVVVEVRAAGVAFPEVLQTRGEYQVKPPCPSSRAARLRGSCAARRLMRASRRATASPPSACSAASPKSPCRRRG